MVQLQTFISFVFVLGMLVLAHEMGHFVVARIHGITVYEFSIGFGPVLWSTKPKETQYSLRALPLGGYVRMMGEDDTSDDVNSFSQKKPWQRFTVLIAGPLMNFVLAVLLYTIIFASIGSATTVVDSVEKGFPGAVAGIEKGDRIVSIANKEIDSWQTLATLVPTLKQSFPVVVERKGQTKTFNLKTQKDKDGRQIIGILPTRDKSLVTALGMGSQTTGDIAKSIFQFLGQMVTGKAKADGVVGPVGIYNVVGQASQAGLLPLLEVAAVISVNLAIFNLLPIPALDGGWLVFIVYEMVFRKPFNRQTQEKLQYAGFMLLMLLMLFTIGKDMKLFG